MRRPGNPPESARVRYKSVHAIALVLGCSAEAEPVDVPAPPAPPTATGGAPATGGTPAAGGAVAAVGGAGGASAGGAPAAGGTGGVAPAGGTGGLPGAGGSGGTSTGGTGGGSGGTPCTEQGEPFEYGSCIVQAYTCGTTRGYRVGDQRFEPCATLTLCPELRDLCL